MRWPWLCFSCKISPRVSNHKPQIAPRVCLWDSVDANDVYNMPRLAPPLVPIRTPDTQRREFPPHPGRVSAGEWCSDSRLQQARHVMEDETTCTPLLPMDDILDTPSPASEQAELVYHEPHMPPQIMSTIDFSEVMVAQTITTGAPSSDSHLPVSSSSAGLTNQATLSRSSHHETRQHYWHSPNYVKPEASSKRSPDIADGCVDAAYVYDPHQGTQHLPDDPIPQQPPQYPLWYQRRGQRTHRKHDEATGHPLLLFLWRESQNGGMPNMCNKPIHLLLQRRPPRTGLHDKGVNVTPSRYTP